MRNRIIKTMLIILTAFFLFNSCKKEEPTQPEIYGPEAKLIISKLVTETYPSPINGDSIQCPNFIFWQRPYHIGDTLAVMVSQDFGAQIIGNKYVFATVTSKLGDSETYWLKGGYWPCETRITDVSIYRSIIYYNTKPLGSPPSAAPNNGELEINTLGDTLIASYDSYSTGNVLYDTVAIIPK
jgi:hypothetical protein